MQPMDCPMCKMQGWGTAGMILGLVVIIAVIAALISLSVFLVRRSRHFGTK
jgi:hypothetical protein